MERFTQQRRDSQTVFLSFCSDKVTIFLLTLHFSAEDVLFHKGLRCKTSSRFYLQSKGCWIGRFLSCVNKMNLKRVPHFLCEQVRKIVNEHKEYHQNFKLGPSSGSTAGAAKAATEEMVRHVPFLRCSFAFSNSFSKKLVIQKKHYFS